MALTENESERLFREKENKIKVNLEEILIGAIGEFGIYQLRILLLTVVLGIFTAFSAMEYMFSTGRINTRCLIPECETPEVAVFNSSWILNAIPERDSSHDNCLRFKSVNNTLRNEKCLKELFMYNVTQSCPEYVYENSNTIVYDYRLACDEWSRSFIGVAHTFGGLLALPITGFISDKWGRRFALTLNAVNTAWLGVVRYWASSYYGYLVLEISKSALGGGVFSSAYILVMELIGSKYRVAAGAALNTSISIGQLLLGLIAWNIPNWRHLILALYIPHFLFISYFWIIPESVRWYMSKGRFREVGDFLRKVTKVNKREISEKLLEALEDTVQAEKKQKAYDEEQKKKDPLLIVLVFRHKEILKRCCVTPVWWMASAFVYYGLSINSTNMSGNRYVNIMAVAASEIPGYWLAVLLMDRIGRKPVLIGAYWTCAVCQLAYIFLPENMYVISLLMYLIGKFSIAIVMMSLYIYTTEIYPTKYRHSLHAFSSMIGKIGTIVVPLTPAFGVKIWHKFPSALFCGFAFTAGALVFLAPETLGTTLPDTMEEASMIGTKRAKQ